MEQQTWAKEANVYFDRWEDKALVHLVEETIDHLTTNSESPNKHVKTVKNIVGFYNKQGYITAKQKWSLSIFASQSKE